MKLVRKFVRNNKGGASVAVAVIMSMVIISAYVQNILMWDEYLRNDDRERFIEQIEIEAVNLNLPVNEVFNSSILGTPVLLNHQTILPSPAPRVTSSGEVYTAEGNYTLDWTMGEITCLETGMMEQNTFYFIEYEYTGLDIAVNNVGETPTHLISLWLNDTRYPIDYYLDVAELKMGIGTNLTLVKIPEITSNQTVIIFTARGNLASFQYPTPSGEGPSPSWDVGTTGVFKINWFYSKYTSETYPNETGAILISKLDTYVAFYVNISNQWSYPVNLTANSFLTLSSLSQISAIVEPIFFIVKRLDYAPAIPWVASSYNATNPLKVEPGQSVKLIFAALSTSGYSVTPSYDKAWKWGKTCPTQASGYEGAGIQISLFYYNSTNPSKIYGQTIATQAVILSPEDP